MKLEGERVAEASQGWRLESRFLMRGKKRLVVSSGGETQAEAGFEQAEPSQAWSLEGRLGVWKGTGEDSGPG